MRQRLACDVVELRGWVGETGRRLLIGLVILGGLVALFRLFRHS